MDQNERLLWLINALLAERPEGEGIRVPNDTNGRRELLRALMNVRMPAPLSPEYVETEEAYLKERLAERGVVRVGGLTPAGDGLYLWQGDITRLDADAIVNAANSQMLGCFRPLHNCIDNCIHTFAGLRLREACFELMKAQGHDEPTGSAKITPAFCLPSKFVIHTVGPIVDGRLTKEHSELLASSYDSCLKLAEENGCESIAFCCISTGVFGFPQREAARVAVDAVMGYRRSSGSRMKVVFNVFKDEDLRIYRELLAKAAL
ncbi:MAG: protein-ADP-ribose hydrolase [Clostridia bacterium]|nr:protein-ADP-ribose hydrolase [Clostridia bacterium]